MDIREAKYLLEIANTRNITKAANNLFITQPGLSKSLNKLEEEFDCPLFFRDGRNLFPTPVGEVVLDYSKRIVHEFNEMYEAIDHIKHKTEDHLRISLPYSGSYLFTNIISEFAIEYPNIVLEPHELGGTQIADLFNQHKLDIAFAMPMGVDVNIDLNEHLVFQSEVIVSVDKSHPFARKEYIEIKDLDNSEFISFDATSHIYRVLNLLFNKEQIHPIPKMLGHDYTWLIAYAKRLNIPCILPRTCFNWFNDPDLVLLPFKPVFEWPLCLAYPKEKQTSNAVMSFVRFVLGRTNIL